MAILTKKKNGSGSKTKSVFKSKKNGSRTKYKAKSNFRSKRERINKTRKMRGGSNFNMVKFDPGSSIKSMEKGAPGMEEGTPPKKSFFSKFIPSKTSYLRPNNWFKGKNSRTVIISPAVDPDPFAPKKTVNPLRDAPAITFKRPPMALPQVLNLESPYGRRQSVFSPSEYSTLSPRNLSFPVEIPGPNTESFYSVPLAQNEPVYATVNKTKKKATTPPPIPPKLYTNYEIYNMMPPPIKQRTIFNPKSKNSKNGKSVIYTNTRGNNFQIPYNTDLPPPLIKPVSNEPIFASKNEVLTGRDPFSNLPLSKI